MTDADWLSQIARNVQSLSTSTGELTGLLKAHTETSRAFQTEARETLKDLSERVAALESTPPTTPSVTEAVTGKKAGGFLTGAVTIITLIGLALIDLAPRIVALWQEAPAEQHEQKAAKK